MRNLRLVAAGLGGVAVLALTYGSTLPASAATARTTPAAVHAAASPSATSQLMARKIGKVDVITDSKGFTLYSFALDTSAKSNCNGSCARYWPPLTGPVTAGPGVTGKIGTIKRSDGSTQATYNGHPLYTYIGDSKPGQDAGNGLNLSGGVWHVVPVSAKAAAPAPSHSTSGGAGGY